MGSRTVKTNNPAPHAGETEAPAIPRDGETPGMGAPPQQTTDREPGTREDGEALPPSTIDPRPDESNYPEERRREEQGNRGPGEVPGFGEGA